MGQVIFDYIIIGGGSAGATLAARLSENPNIEVCLLEAGGQGDSLVVRTPIGVLAMIRGRPKINNWAYKTVPQKGLNGRTGYQPRGKALGGSSAINALLYVRGHKNDYDEWADIGCTGWSWDEVLPYFKKSENNEWGENEMHGASGPLHVSDQKSPRPITHAFVEAATQMQHSHQGDFNGGENEGAGLYQVTQFHNKEKMGNDVPQLQPIYFRSLSEKTSQSSLRPMQQRFCLKASAPWVSCIAMAGPIKPSGPQGKLS